MAEQVAKAGHNGFDPEHAKTYVARFEECQAEIDAIMQAARQKCQPIRDDMKTIKGEAADDGIPKKEFASIIRKRRLLAKAEAVRDGLSEAQRSTFDNLALALGMLADTPLGEAALAKEKAA